MTFENHCGRLTKASKLPIENEIRNLEHRRATWEASLSIRALFCSRRFPKGGMLMKNKIKRSVLYPIRAVLLLLIFSLLLTGCVREEPFYKSSLDMYRGQCIAVSGTNESHVYDIDKVILNIHYGITTAPNESDKQLDVPYIDLYFVSSDVKNEPVGYHIKREDGNYFDEKYWCHILPSGEGREHMKKGLWETVTVPKEIFTEEAGFFKYYVYTFYVIDEDVEDFLEKAYFVPNDHEKPMYYMGLKIYYEKIGEDKIKLITDK